MSASPQCRFDDLGGRLRLLPVDALDASQAALHARLVTRWLARADAAGYRFTLPDGRLLGPFNGLLRVPAIGGPQLAWAQAIADGGLPADVREAVILTVGVEWAAAYVLHAHSQAARQAGISEADIDAIRTARHDQVGLSPKANLAHRLTVALVRDHDVPDALYAEVIDTFGESATVTLVVLIGQYLTTSALLTCFQVPAPPDQVS